MWPTCFIQERLDTRQKDMGEHFAGDGEKCYWSVVAAVCLVTFSFIQCDYNTILPVTWYVACSPDRQEYGMECSGDWHDCELE